MDRQPARPAAPDPLDDGLSEVARLVARCLERLDREGSGALSAMCAEHPEHADELRRRIGGLRDIGLLGRGRLGPYELLRTLGQGGMGLVYLARDERLSRLVALKALPSRLVVSPRAAGRFQREIRTAAQLRHPRIVPIYDVGEADGVPYFTMEWIDGRTLAEIVARLREAGRPPARLTGRDLFAAAFGGGGGAPGADAESAHEESAGIERSDSQGAGVERAEAERADEQGAGIERADIGPADEPGAGVERADAGLADDERADAEGVDADAAALPGGWAPSYVEGICRIVLDVADALAYAHGKQVVHRDVKPSNVVVRRDGRAQLLDFGLARVQSDDPLTISGDFTGTPYYVAPEQVSGRRRVDRRSDVYALGVTLYELLTLRRPFEGGDAQEVFRNILVRDPDPVRAQNPAVPRDLETVCLTALEKDGERRYQGADELAADLRRFLRYEPVRARPVGRLRRLARLARRNRWATAALALTALVLVGTPLALLRVAAVVAAERDLATGQQRLAEQQAALARTAADEAARARARAEAETTRAAEQAQRAAEETQRAEAEAARAAGEAQRAEAALAEAEVQRRRAEASLETTQAVNDLLLDILHAPGPLQGGRDVTVREVLEDASVSLSERLAGRPHVEVALRNALGRAFLELGLLAPARGELERAWALCRAEDEAPAGAPDAATTIAPSDRAQAMESLGVVLVQAGQQARAAELLEGALALRRELHGEAPSEEVASVLNNLSSLQQGDEALATRRLVLEMRRQVFGEPSRPVAEALINLSLASGRLGSEQRLELAQQAAAMAQRLPPPDDSVAPTALLNLGTELGAAGRHDEAHARYEEALGLALRQHGDLHPLVSKLHRALWTIVRSRGEWETAERHAAEVVRIERRLDPGGVNLPWGLHRLGEACFRLGRALEAEACFVEALALFRAARPDTHPDVGGAMADLVQLRRMTGDEHGARELLHEFERVYRDAPAHLTQWRAIVSELVRIDEALGESESARAWRDRLARGPGG